MPFGPSADRLVGSRDSTPWPRLRVEDRSVELACPCCGERKVVFAQDVTEELDTVPAKFFVNRYVRFKYACRKREGYVSEGALPPRPMDKCIPGPGPRGGP